MKIENYESRKSIKIKIIGRTKSQNHNI